VSGTLEGHAAGALPGSGDAEGAQQPDFECARSSSSGDEDWWSDAEMDGEGNAAFMVQVRACWTIRWDSAACRMRLHYETRAGHVHAVVVL
jgi:hypothetical protein